MYIVYINSIHLFTQWVQHCCHLQSNRVLPVQSLKFNASHCRCSGRKCVNSLCCSFKENLRDFPKKSFFFFFPSVPVAKIHSLCGHESSVGSSQRDVSRCVKGSTGQFFTLMQKQNKAKSGLPWTGGLLMFCIVWMDGDHTALWTSLTLNQPLCTRLCVFFLSSNIMQQPRRQNNTQDSTMWLGIFFGSLTFLFIKFIPFCQEELAAFIISFEEGGKKRKNRRESVSLFLGDIENSLCSRVCFTTSWHFLAQMCKTCHLAGVMV